MEFITDILGTRNDGTRIVKNYYLYPTKQNNLKNAQKEFTKNEKKLAKSTYKNSLKNNPLHKQGRVELVEKIVKSTFPNWNIKLNFL
jgi:hypothetical protein